MEDIIRYILRFFAGERLSGDTSRIVCQTADSSHIDRFIGYTSDTALFSGYKVVIIPSGFFDEGMYGTNRSNPTLPLEKIEGTPFLFGSPKVERVGDTIVVHADLVASAYFMISRYEEILHRDRRDEHGRFPGCESLPYRAGFIDRPVVDEYGSLIRKWLKESGVDVNEYAPFIRKVNLTHDVDAPFLCRTWRNVARVVLSGRSSITTAVRDKYKPVEQDMNYTFPWMLEQNRTLQDAIGSDRCESLLFFRAGGTDEHDKPRYGLHGKDIRALFDLCRKNGATVGLHSSYQAGIDPSLILSEKKHLEDAFGAGVTQNRHHFLASREPEDMEYLEKAGITNDYTLGYADVAGFRLGTASPVRYINPITRRMSSSLTLHPLTFMDGTLHESKYMHLTSEEAWAYCQKLIDNVRNANGELTILWHNTSAIEGNSYLKELYTKIVKLVESGKLKIENGEWRVEN